MNRAAVLYAGALLTVIASFLGLVNLPGLQLSDLQPVEDSEGQKHPVEPVGWVATGREVYRDLGCLYCHSQQVRPQGFGADIERGWGSRRTVARDHLYDAPALLGTMRTGPDLVNIGARQPSESWHLVHLYDPTLTSPRSNMPPFPFPFRRRRIEGERPSDCVDMPPGVVPEGLCLAPTTRAKALVAYLRSLDHSYDVPEAK